MGKRATSPHKKSNANTSSAGVNKSALFFHTSLLLAWEFRKKILIKNDVEHHNGSLKQLQG